MRKHDTFQLAALFYHNVVASHDILINTAQHLLDLDIAHDDAAGAVAEKVLIKMQA